MAQAPRFYPDDPVSHAPAPRPVGDLPVRKTPLLFDFLYNSLAPHKPSHHEARGINTIGEALDSEWYTNRHGKTRMSLDELRRGPNGLEPPQPPFEVIDGKNEGINPGFQMRDARKRLFFVKFDPPGHPGLATAPDVIGTKFFYAFGYNTPDNYIFIAAAEDFQIAGDAKFTGDSGDERRMRRSDFNRILAKAQSQKDGRIRFVASRAIEGKPIGPFRFAGTRSDDPNDNIPHEDRRDLRGLAIFSAWLNHTDSKAGNTLDVIVEENGVKFVKHYLLDFGSSLGSDSIAPKDARDGYEYFLSTEWKPMLRDMGLLGLHVKPWETAHYPRQPSIGRFGSQPFNPDEWVSNFPNHAFESRRPDDGFWAARQVMRFSAEEIRAIVETGQYSDAKDTDYLVQKLIERRDIIGKTIFAKVLPLDKFRVLNNRLEFEDLAVKYGFLPSRQYDFAWSRMDNRSANTEPLSGQNSAELPADWQNASIGSYYEARVIEKSRPDKAAIVSLQKTTDGAKVVGIRRTW
jgi:hypothetical protein